MKKYWNFYNNLKEPYRFFMMLLMASPFFIGIYTKNYFVLSITICFLISKIYYENNNKKK